MKFFGAPVLMVGLAVVTWGCDEQPEPGQGPAGENVFEDVPEQPRTAPGQPSEFDPLQEQRDQPGQPATQPDQRGDGLPDGDRSGQPSPFGENPQPDSSTPAPTGSPEVPGGEIDSGSSSP